MMSDKILVYLDQFKGQALPASWEVISAAFHLSAKLGGDVIALAIGSESGAVAAEAFQYGASAAFYGDDPSLADYRPEPYTSLLVKVAKEQGAGIILFPTTTRGRELAAICALDLGSGVMPDVSALEAWVGFRPKTPLETGIERFVEWYRAYHADARRP